MIAPPDNLPRDAHEWGELTDSRAVPVFRSRRGRIVPVDPASNGFDPRLRNLRRFVAGLGCGAFVAALIAGAWL